MKFTVFSGKLLKELSKINSIIPSNPIVPILNNVLLEITDNQLRITGSDQHTFITTTLDINGSGQGSIAVSARILTQTMKQLAEQPLDFLIDTNNSYSVEIISSNGRYKLAGENAVDFPKPKPTQNSNWITVKNQILKQALQQTIFAASKDELRPILRSIHIAIDKKGATFVATDGRRLAKYTSNQITTEDNQALTIPTKPLQTLVQLLQPTDENLQIRITEDNAQFLLDNILLITRLINLEYPNYKNVIPSQQQPYKLTINTIEYLKALKTVDIYSNRTTHQLKVTANNNILEISTEDLDFYNEAKETIPCHYSGKEVQIGFNGKLLIEMISTVDSEEIEMHFDILPNKAVLFFPQNSTKTEELLLLIMPVLLNKHPQEL